VSLTPARWLFIPALLLCHAAAFGQCYDLRSTVLVREYSRFVEHWKDSDVRFDNDGWGDMMHFAPLSAGIVRKTVSGWEPLRTVRHPRHYFELAANGGVRGYLSPYVTPPAAASLRRGVEDIETWAITREGILTYTRRYISPLGPRNESGEHQTDGTFDLNSGRYEVVFKDHMVGVHRHIKKEGVELWRENPFRAKATLRQVPCPSAVKTVAFRIGDTADVPETELILPPPCVVKVKEFTGQGTAAIPTKWEFVLNPAKVTSYEGCVLAFENEPASSVAPVRVAKSQDQ
jgi:hypothetical protein